MKFPSLALVAAHLGCALSSCALLGSTTQYRLEGYELPGTLEMVEVVGGRHGQLAWNGLGTAIEPAVARLRGETFELRVRTRPISWDQWFFGPVLPVFPILMGAGSTPPELVLDLELLSAEAPVYLEAVLLSLPEGGRFGVLRVLRDGEELYHWTAARDEPCPELSLEVGESLALHFHPQPLWTPRFTTVLRLRVPRSSGTREIALSFESVTGTFYGVAWAP